MSDASVGQVKVVGRALDGTVDPVALYDALVGDRRDTLLLEAAEPEAQHASRSVMMSRAALRITIRGRQVVVTPLSAGGENVIAHLAPRFDGAMRDGRLEVTFPPRPKGDERTRLMAPSVLDVVRETLASMDQVEGDRAHPPMVVGSFAYDLHGCYEELPQPREDPIGWPDAELWLAEELVWIEPRQHRIHALRYAFGGERPTYHDAVSGLAALVVTCQSSPQREVPPAASPGEPTVDLDDDGYAAKVVALKEHIVAGDVFQIVPSRRFSLPCPDPLSAYARLRVVEPSPYMFFVRGQAGTLFGASPESALKVTKDRKVTICPIAGTRRRGHVDGVLDRDLDGRIEAELRLDDKEVAEHMMLVDLARNDVARVSEAGTRSVTRLLDVVRYSRVMHLISEVEGQLKEGLDALHAYVATMNMGTLVGAPKIEAAHLLRLHEAERRGPYGGAVGYWDADGVFDSAIVIRSAVAREGVGTVRAGAGVVHDSVPLAEADETRRKAAAVLSILGQATTEDGV